MKTTITIIHDTQAQLSSIMTSVNAMVSQGVTRAAISAKLRRGMNAGSGAMLPGVPVQAPGTLAPEYEKKTKVSYEFNIAE